MLTIWANLFGWCLKKKTAKKKKKKFEHKMASPETNKQTNKQTKKQIQLSYIRKTISSCECTKVVSAFLSSCRKFLIVYFYLYITDCNKKTIQSENRTFENFFRINSIVFFHIS